MSKHASKIRLIMELRRSGITDTRVLAAIERIPREEFVLPTFADQAYENLALPIGHGQTISQPYVVAFMTQALQVEEKMKVLEVGTGSGYQAAVLSKMCRRLYTIERYRPLAEDSEKRLQHLRCHNVVVRVADGTKGWREQAPFDRIIVTAAGREVPPLLLEQLGDNGVLVMPMGPDPLNQSIMRLKKTERGIERESLLPVRFVPLVPGALPEASDF
ncbi:MAG: Protein-L-isoaspartate carboxylmethyltransferase [Alphaproteobacteria bacterium]|jgi:protein-L-isoaspartate(D-aspartate) O-methyltransferase|nr:Protein-L-isoaspartate carboxylmethyltransferase [Alphaproteobacteria bacterium]